MLDADFGVLKIRVSVVRFRPWPPSISPDSTPRARGHARAGPDRDTPASQIGERRLFDPVKFQPRSSYSKSPLVTNPPWDKPLSSSQILTICGDRVSFASN